ncbi:unnamed protein product [Schistocephalus solidus]|uniref:Secreted protein n=1 Tax=Schistocephalus solidus TaxID=70667 RepID=A0A183SR18_SCHSO|nr:unnamed protein product [Schistocephalus solidus]
MIGISSYPSVSWHIGYWFLLQPGSHLITSGKTATCVFRQVSNIRFETLTSTPHPPTLLNNTKHYEVHIMQLAGQLASIFPPKKLNRKSNHPGLHTKLTIWSCTAALFRYAASPQNFPSLGKARSSL